MTLAGDLAPARLALGGSALGGTVPAGRGEDTCELRDQLRTVADVELLEQEAKELVA